MDTGQYPPTPFSYMGPYSLEIANVDFADATGHAIDLNAGNTVGKKNNDIYIHGGAINFSGVTGILGLTDYPDKYCDGYAANNSNIAFADAQGLPAPRNIGIENTLFNSNNTGAMGGGAYRWLGLRNNTFTNNYVNPPAGQSSQGGTIELVGCSDMVEISGNTFIGPSWPTTDGLELYGRNMNVHENSNISGFGFEGIGAHSLYNSTIANNNIHDNSWNATTGGIKLVTSFATGGCGGVPRDTQGGAVTGNTSSNQPYGIHFADQQMPSRNTLSTVSLSGNILTPSIPGDQVTIDPTVVLSGYSGTSPVVVNGSRTPSLYALGVDSVSWQYPRCSSPGTQRMTFTLPVKDDQGSSNVTWIEGMFSIGGDDTTGVPGPDTGAQGCHFHYDRPSNLIYLGPIVGGYNWILPASPIGGGGFDYGNDPNNPTCTIHASTSSILAEPFALTLTLDITFPSSSSSSNRKHIYTVTENNQGKFSNTDTWAYWGWWATQ